MVRGSQSTSIQGEGLNRVIERSWGPFGVLSGGLWGRVRGEGSVGEPEWRGPVYLIGGVWGACGLYGPIWVIRGVLGA